MSMRESKSHVGYTIAERQHSLQCWCPVSAMAEASIRVYVCHTLRFYQNDASWSRNLRR